MATKYQNYREEAIRLRNQGITYTEIANRLGLKVPKSTLSYWLANIRMNDEYHRRMKMLSNENLSKARIISVEARRKKRLILADELRVSNKQLFLPLLTNLTVKKLLLVCLYWAEGGKGRADLMFANSDPLMIQTFLSVLRQCYDIDESKFRVTLQCRADSDVSTLEAFWSKITGIKRELFYRALIDPRTVGKPTLKTDYKGVCRIAYFSAEIFNDIIQASKVLPELVG